MKRVDFEVMDRVAFALGSRTRVELCKKINTPLNTYDSWKRKGYVSKSAIIKIAHDHGLNLNWVLTGEGRIFCTDIIKSKEA
jgi:hypothetical protein